MAVLATISVLTVVAVIGTAVAIMVASNPYPSDWDPRVEPYVAFVEQERGLGFEHPVHVDFMEPDAFDALLTAADEAPTDEDQAAYDEAAALLRALGLHEGALDVADETDQLYEAGVLAYYSSDDKRVRVKGTELTPEVAVTLVHELVHALQDQNFDLSKLDELETSTAQSAFRTVVEGDAVWVEEQYLASLPTAERERLEAAEAADAEQAQGEVEDLNDVLVTSFAAPYILGPPFLTLLHADGGYAAVDRSLRSPPPDEGAIFDPTDHLDGLTRPSLDPPRPPVGADPMSDDERLAASDSLGAVTFFMMLAARLDPHVALEATDLLAGDRMLTYTEGDRTCVAIDAATDGDDDAGALEETLDDWVAAMPVEAGATADRSGTTIEVRSCDPGEDVAMEIQGSPADTVWLPAIRLHLVADALEQDVPEPQAVCFADTFTRNVTVEELVDEDATPEQFDDLRTEAMLTCMG